MGGAFYGQGPRELSISHSEFFENTSLTNGGAAYVGPLPMPADLDTAYIRFENVLWHHNIAGVNVPGDGYYGGALAGVTSIGSGDVIDIVNLSLIHI